MAVQSYTWARRGEFLNRAEELSAIERWWEGRDRRLLAVYGRRRVGKSWLFRAFAAGKPAVVLVAERGSPHDQLRKLAAGLEGALGVRPDLSDLPDLFRILYRLGRDRRVLVVIDEFPHLLPGTKAKREAMLTAIQAVVESEQDDSRAKFILCGSQIGQMEKLLAEQSPLHGRLYRFFVSPLGPGECKDFVEAADARDWIERYAVSGGMPFYLTDLARGGPLRDLLCAHVLNRHGALFNEPPYVLQQELRQPGFYLSILEQLARGPRRMENLARALGETGQSLSAYLKTLRELRIIDRELPAAAPAKAVGYRYRLTDGFFRFWFRFVRPYQDQLEAGLDATDLWDAEVAPALADHIAPAFEALCRRWVRENLGRQASRVGSWWGPALNELRRSGERESEELDIVGMHRGRVSVVGECKWTAKPLSVGILKEISEFKLPALAQGGGQLRSEGPVVVLFARSGFTKGLRDAAGTRNDLRLVELGELVP